MPISKNAVPYSNEKKDMAPDANAGVSHNTQDNHDKEEAANTTTATETTKVSGAKGCSYIAEAMASTTGRSMAPASNSVGDTMARRSQIPPLRTWAIPEDDDEEVVVPPLQGAVRPRNSMEDILRIDAILDKVEAENPRFQAARVHLVPGQPVVSPRKQRKAKGSTARTNNQKRNRSTGATAPKNKE
jgi:hypothetical protein